jgi:multiple sugar transport system substrate-binding protein
MIAKKLHVPLALATTALAVTALAGCSTGGSGGGGGDAASGTYTWWDPYPQHEEGSDWANRVQACGDEAGVTIERTAYDTTALTNQALLAAQENNSPDVILLDNPAVSTLAETGMVSTVEELGLDVSTTTRTS